MKTILTAVCFLIASLASTSAFSQSVENRIAELLTQAKEDCASDGGVLDLSGDEVNKFDFDGDGVTDLSVLHEIDYNCSSSASLFQGTAGAVVHIMTDKDYFSGYVREVQAVTAFDNKQVILLGLHGSACDEAGYIRCVKAITLHEGRIISTKGH
ncbi:hypothetical protein N9I17_05840 [Amylibacter sp.]|nr:hypothetical protein [Amylibacter sp.]